MFYCFSRPRVYQRHFFDLMVCPTSPQAPHLGGPFAALEPELAWMGVACALGEVSMVLGFLAGVGMAKLDM